MDNALDVSIEQDSSTFNGSVTPMPYGVKKRLVLCKAFYLPQDVFVQMLRDVEHDIPRDVGMGDMAYVVAVIDRYGQWHSS